MSEPHMHEDQGYERSFRSSRNWLFLQFLVVLIHNSHVRVKWLDSVCWRFWYSGDIVVVPCVTHVPVSTTFNGARQCWRRQVETLLSSCCFFDPVSRHESSPHIENGHQDPLMRLRSYEGQTSSSDQHVLHLECCLQTF